MANESRSNNRVFIIGAVVVAALLAFWLMRGSDEAATDAVVTVEETVEAPAAEAPAAAAPAAEAPAAAAPAAETPAPAADAPAAGTTAPAN